MGDDPRDHSGAVMPTVTGVPVAPMPSGPPAMPTGSPTQPGSPPSMPAVAPTAAGMPLPDSHAPAMPTFTGGPMPVSFAPELPSEEQPSLALDRYRIGAEIARGGMGRVVEALDTVLGRTVALKLVLSADDDTLRRFARETRITARLEHPAIVPVHDAGGVDPESLIAARHGLTVPFYVMRKISGRPLEKLVALAENLSQRLVLVPHLVQSAHAIAHAHERGIVHRDIKPSNILVGDNGETIVIDWGLAKEIAEPEDPRDPHAPMPSAVIDDNDDVIKTRAGIVYGTPGFMAPEQLRGKPVDEKCDVYALGATLYHLLYRKPPHYSRDAAAMMKDAAHHPAKPLAKVLPGVPAELATIVDTALAFDATVRYQNARQLADDLQRFLDGQLVASHHYTRRERIGRWVRKHRIALTVAGAALLSLVGLGTISISRVIHERDRANDERTIAQRERKAADVARTKADQRADDLVLAQARTLVSTAPAQALALAQTLATSHPRETKSIATAAYAQGVPAVLEASSTTAALALTRDGSHALSTGTDGAVRLHDLAAHTTKLLVTVAPGSAVQFTDDERHLVAWTAQQLVVLDLPGLGRHELALPRAIQSLTSVGSTLYWTTVDGELWTLDVATTAPVAVTMPEPAGLVSASPDGTWLLVGGPSAVRVFALPLVEGAPAALEIHGEATLADWAANSTRVAVRFGDDDGAELDMADPPAMLRRAFLRGKTRLVETPLGLLAAGPTGMAYLSGPPRPDRAPLGGEPIAMAKARGGVVVAASAATIAVLSPDGDHTLAFGAGRVTAVAATKDGPYVVAAVGDHLLAWNLDDMEPKRSGSPATFLRYADRDHAIVSDEGVPAEWVTLATGERSDLADWGALRDVAAAPDGSVAAVLDEQRRVHLVHFGTPPVDVPGTADTIGFASPTLLVLAATSGTIDVYDVRVKQRRTLVKRDAPVTALAWSQSGPGWVTAAFGDRGVWRGPVTANAAGAATITAPVAATAVAITADGTVLYGAARYLRTWRGSDAAPPANAPALTLPRALARLAITSDAASPAIAVLDDGSTLLVAGSTVTPSVQLTNLDAKFTAGGLTVEEHEGGIDIVDPLAIHRWTLASAPQSSTQLDERNVRAYQASQLAPDGSRVLAETRSALLVWSLHE